MSRRSPFNGLRVSGRVAASLLPLAFADGLGEGLLAHAAATGDVEALRLVVQLVPTLAVGDHPAAAGLRARLVRRLAPRRGAARGLRIRGALRVLRHPL